VKNVLVLVAGGERFAVELRWVREICPLPPVTPVPTAPPPIVGAVNMRGAIVPVLSVAPGRGPRAGDALVLIDVDGVSAGLWAERIDAVKTLGPDTDDDDQVPLLDPAGLLKLLS
jgi:purine-binding chemotaxis protein CheW